MALEVLQWHVLISANPVNVPKFPMLCFFVGISCRQSWKRHSAEAACCLSFFRVCDQMFIQSRLVCQQLFAHRTLFHFDAWHHLLVLFHAVQLLGPEVWKPHTAPFVSARHILLWCLLRTSCCRDLLFSWITREFDDQFFSCTFTFNFETGIRSPPKSPVKFSWGFLSSFFILVSFCHSGWFSWKTHKIQKGAWIGVRSHLSIRSDLPGVRFHEQHSNTDTLDPLLTPEVFEVTWYTRIQHWWPRNSCWPRTPRAATFG